MTDLPFLPGEPDPTAIERRPRKAAPWERPPADPVIARRNRLNRSRGKGTSRELAAYLGWQNVEGMNWPWDIQSATGRIQSKRDALARSGSARVRLIEAIPFATGYLRGLFHVAPRQRLASGSVTFGLREWTEWHGWEIPAGSALLLGGSAALIEMPLPLFRDIHGGETR